MTKNPLAWLFTSQPLKIDARQFTLYKRTLTLRIVVRVVAVVAIGLFTAGRGPRDLLIFTATVMSILAVFRLLAGEGVPLLRYGGYLLAIVASYLLATYLHQRTRLTLALSALTVAVFLWELRKLVRFQREFMIAGRGEIERDEKFPIGAAVISTLILLAFCGVAVVVPVIHSNTAGLIAVMLLAATIWIAGMIYTRSVGELFAGMRQWIMAFSGYPDTLNDYDYQSAWTRPQRVAAYGRVWGSLCLLVCVALSFGLPWEPFAAAFQPGYVWKPLPPEYFQDMAWLVEPPGRALFGSAGYLLVFPCGLLLLLALPTLMLTAALLPVLCSLRGRRPVEQEQLSDAERFARMTDRLHKSRDVYQES
jgi:hypothetical protein